MTNSPIAHIVTPERTLDIDGVFTVVLAVRAHRARRPTPDPLQETAAGVTGSGTPAFDSVAIVRSNSRNRPRGGRPRPPVPRIAFRQFENGSSPRGRSVLTQRPAAVVGLALVIDPEVRRAAGAWTRGVVVRIMLYVFAHDVSLDRILR